MRRFLSVLLAVVFFVAAAVPVSAKNAGTSELVIHLKDGSTPLHGAKIEIFKVGEERRNGQLVLIGEFASYPVTWDNSVADTLYSYAKMNEIDPDITVEIGSEGKILVPDMEAGLYLITGLPFRFGGFQYQIESQLVQLPQKNPATGEMLETADCHLKFLREQESERLISRRAIKIWEDGSGEERPASVTVHLLKNGSVYSTVSLTGVNSWRHVWENLDPNAQWQIIEEVPSGYTVSVTQEGNAFLITNRFSDNKETEPSTEPSTEPPAEPPTEFPTNPSESGTESPAGKIPQTGMLWWPMVIAMFSGVLLIAAGFFEHGNKKKFLMLSGTIVMILAALPAVGNMLEQAEAADVSQEVLLHIEQIPEENPVLSAQVIPDYQYNPSMDMPEELVDGIAYIGTVEIPALELNLPVISTTTQDNLKKAPCRYSGSAYQDDLILGAHNYKKHFGRIKSLSYEDQVMVTDLDGNIFSYQVADIEILKPDQVEDLIGGDWALTLYTCTPGGGSRVVVRCLKTE